MGAKRGNRRKKGKGKVGSHGERERSHFTFCILQRKFGQGWIHAFQPMLGKVGPQTEHAVVCSWLQSQQFVKNDFAAQTRVLRPRSRRSARRKKKKTKQTTNHLQYATWQPLQRESALTVCNLARHRLHDPMIDEWQTTTKPSRRPTCFCLVAQRADVGFGGTSFLASSLVSCSACSFRVQTRFKRAAHFVA